MPPISRDELIHTESELARNIIEARRSRDAAAQAVEQIFITTAELKARLPIAEADLAGAEQLVLEAEGARTRFRDQRTMTARLAAAREEQESAIRRATERAATSEANLVRAQEERIIAAEGLAVVLGKELTP